MIKVGIVGGTGYTGVELLRLLANHPNVTVEVITSRSNDGLQVAEMFPSLRPFYDLAFSKPSIDRLAACDLVFFATPNGTAMKMVPDLLKQDTKVIDLAADFRIKSQAIWEQWYNMEHACPDLLETAVYGLPELNREQIKTASLIANPGCYPTATILAFLPLLKSNLIDPDALIADCKSGASGAGRGANVAALMAECGESFKAYGVAGHRHLPEISQVLSWIAEKPQNLTFVPHLIPMIRGIHATLYAKLMKEGVDLQALYEETYKNEPFVDVLPAGTHPETRSVRGNNFCQIAIHQIKDSQQLVILSVIDNLVKGAAGQAIQNMNITCGLDEKAGLNQVALLP